MKYNDIINLLTTHRDKDLIRKIIFYNLTNIIEINNINVPYSFSFISFDESKFPNFIMDLIEISEIKLAEEAIYLINKYKLERGFSFNYHLVDKLVYQLTGVNTVNVLVNLLGEDEFIDKFNDIIIDKNFQRTTLKNFLSILILLKKFDFLIRVIEVLVNNNYEGNKKIISKILQNIKKDIRSENIAKIIKYINIISSMNIFNTISSGNRQENRRNELRFNTLIKEIEDDK